LPAAVNGRSDVFFKSGVLGKFFNTGNVNLEVAYSTTLCGADFITNLTNNSLFYGKLVASLNSVCFAGNGVVTKDFFKPLTGLSTFGSITLAPLTGSIDLGLGRFLTTLPLSRIGNFYTTNGIMGTFAGPIVGDYFFGAKYGYNFLKFKANWSDYSSSTTSNSLSSSSSSLSSIIQGDAAVWYNNADSDRPIRFSTDKLYEPSFFAFKLDNTPTLRLRFFRKSLFDWSQN
jgi:hypothetical protein